MTQCTRHILLVRPAAFGFNAETAVTNAFQNSMKETADEVNNKAVAEFDKLAAVLQSKGVQLIIEQDNAEPPKPDAIFPNNWLSMHGDGTLILYPMQAQNRRCERRSDIVENLKQQFQIHNIIDLSAYENDHQFLEGTGSIVFDHAHKTAYACLSPRTDKTLLLKVADLVGYRAVCFHADDKNGKAIYHTNVMMCVSEHFAVVCFDSITNSKERELIRSSLEQTNHAVIDISFSQMNRFAGNMLSLKTAEDRIITALSQTAFDCLTATQKQAIDAHSELVPLSIPTIETIGGGSVRCMIAEIFLPERNSNTVVKH